MAKRKTAKIIDGKATAQIIKDEIKAEVARVIDKGQEAPHLAAILVGDDPASQTYVASKEKAAKRIGITSSVYNFPADITEEELLETIDFLNNDQEINGFIVQLPLPEHIDTDKVLNRIDPSKDVDGFHPVNIGRMALGLPSFVSATPAGIIELKTWKTTCGALIDVGIHRVPADNEKGYSIVGDVAYDEVVKKASYITPVPGGVGPMTIAMLLKNTLHAAKNDFYK